MSVTSTHLDWLVDTGRTVSTADGLPVRILEFQHKSDDELLSAWAKHFRNHYCLDAQIDALRNGTGLSRSEYLNKLKFPSTETNLGPGIRAGDFAEILIADYVEWRLNYWVPRFRWNGKMVTDESNKGCDVIGFQCKEAYRNHRNDVMLVFESKARFSKAASSSRLQDAIDDSVKDEIRIDESLNFIKQRLLDSCSFQEAAVIGRFQNRVDHPFKEKFAAAALYTDEAFNDNEITGATATNANIGSKKNPVYGPHPKRSKLELVVVSGPEMMNLTNELYRRASDEA
jgi:hypothetical protein